MNPLALWSIEDADDGQSVRIGDHVLSRDDARLIGARLLVAAGAVDPSGVAAVCAALDREFAGAPSVVLRVGTETRGCPVRRTGEHRAVARTSWDSVAYLVRHGGTYGGFPVRVTMSGLGPVYLAPDYTVRARCPVARLDALPVRRLGAG